ncbi:MAG: hypothetical protein K0R21_1954 [Anaerocolumna sp.]|jgi:hypothetical protein|nr:hypothetical protein [Anaerocolumna sp.]
MRNKFSQIQKQYRFDEEHNAYLIEISLDDYDDVYDEWDPAPFKKRFIQAEFDDFILSSAEDIPLKYGLNVVLYLPETKKDVNKEAAVEAAYRNYYSYEIMKVAKSMAKLSKKTLSNFLLSMAFLSLGYFFQFGQDSVIFEVVQEGIFIGGWVFLWEFFTNIITTRRELIAEHQLYKRIYQSKLLYVYTKQAQ